MTRYLKTPVTQLSANESAALQQINKNLDDIQSAIQDTVSRSGQSPTQMTADLDLNGKRIINVPAPLTDNDLVRRVDVVGDVAMVQQLVNAASTAAGQAIAAAEGVQEAIADAHVGIVADDLILGDDSKIRIAANNIDDISACVDDITDIKAVGENISNVNAVADNIFNVGTVATNIGDINDCADNMSSITGASTQAANAASSATSAAASAQAAAISAAGTHFKLFHHDWFDYELNDMAWLRADTFSWQDGTVYTNAYQHLVDDVTNGTSQTETISGHTITYTLADDGHKIVSDANASEVEGLYNDTGVAWYYILDLVNHRFKLPRTKYGFTGYRDEVGKYVEAGLPNITGNLPNARVGSYSSSGIVGTGALRSYNDGATGLLSPTGSGFYVKSQIDLDASDSNSIYGNSTTVQPPATQMYLYFYVGQFSQSATEQTAGLNAELFNGKADVDLNNLSASGLAKFTAKLDADKIQQVSTLPVSPVAGTLYLIPE